MNRQKTQIVDALRTRLPVPMLLATISLSSSSSYYQCKVMHGPDMYTNLRKHIAATTKARQFTYGYRRIWWGLRHAGVTVSEKVVRRLMVQDQSPVHGAKNKPKWTSYQGELSPAPPNLVQRNFHTEALCQLWLTDITEFSVADGKVIGTKTDRTPVMQLAEDALAQALADHPGATQMPLGLHSNRGGHYRSRGWIRRTQGAGITRSLSKKGYTRDNTTCEGFFGRMKNEMYYDRTRLKVSLGGYSSHAYRRLNQLEPELS